MTNQHAPLAPEYEKIARIIVNAAYTVHTAQILTYLKLTEKRLGFLINFNVPIIKQGIKRVIL